MMTDQNAGRSGEDSAEYVAYVMTRDILFRCENRKWEHIDRKLLLDTYSECLQAVSSRRDWRAIGNE